MGAVESEPGESFEAVYVSHRLELERLAFLLSGDRGLAQDVVQSVFTEALPRWDSITERLPYLRRAVANRVADAQRRSFRWRRLPRARERISEIPEIDETWMLIRALPRTQRHAVVLRYYEGLEPSEIAAVLNRNPSTVRSDLRRALATLRKGLT